MSAAKRNCTVLIVEDDSSIQEMMQFALEVEGYDVATAGNGAEALDALKRIDDPCVILLDLMMPTMDGWEFMDRISQDSKLKAVPIVVISAFADREFKLPVQVMPKPIQLKALQETVYRHCG